MQVVPMRLPSDLIARISAWAEVQQPPIEGRSKAIRALIERALAGSL